MRCPLLMLSVLVFAGSESSRSCAADQSRLNVILIITDDQGYGDLGFHGNPKIKTPNLDKLAKESVQLKHFYVSPVCSPTRASLMTGRYNFRTGVVDTYLGRSMMHPDEVTIAEMLGAAGYRTGIFGKWHLGDNYPLRAMDQGFQESLVLKGGGIGQPSDPPGGDSYFNPTLYHNGKAVKTKGYCSDVLTKAAIQFITTNKDKSFFTYLAFNCPHTPLEVPESYLKPYQEMNLGHDQFPKTGHPLPGQAQQDVTAKIYGMVTNIDDNLGRLFKKLEELKLAENTIVIFLTDNGPQQVRYNAGMLNRKGNTHEGGIRVPCFVRWPAKLKAGYQVEQIAAHIDIAPTLLDACAVKQPDKVAFDGKSLLPLLKGEKVDWPDRTLYFQWHRGDEPELFRAFAARSQQFKLVQPLGANAQKLPDPLPFRLYDMVNDPLEMKDLAAEKPDLVKQMKEGYEAWFKSVSATRGYAPPRIHLGSPKENPTLLTRQDWRGPKAGWTPDSIGHWEVEITRDGSYEITLRFKEVPDAATAVIVVGKESIMQEVRKGATSCVFEGVKLSAGPARLEGRIELDKKTVGVEYVEVKKE